MLGLLSIAAGSSGCATLGFAVAGPLFSGVAAIADRSVEKTIPADQVTTWGVTVDALSRMAVRLEETDKSGERWVLKGTGEAVTVHGTLERVTTRMTRVSIRVEAGTLLADKKTGDEILNQVSVSLASLERVVRETALPPRPDVSAERLSALQREIERLGVTLNGARDAAPPSSMPGAAPPPPAGPTGVIVIPASAGVPTVPFAAGSARPDVVPSVAVRPPAIAREADPSRRNQPPRPERDLAEHVFPATLVPVGVLSPVGALSSGGTGQ
jgi:hypothetical protein